MTPFRACGILWPYMGLTMKDMKERRRDTRVLDENRVVIGMRGAPGDRLVEPFDAFTRDLSLGGVRVQTDKPLDTGVELTLTITLSRSRQIVRIHGRVQWVREVEEGLFEAGIEFLHQVPANIMSLIDHLFRKRTGDPPPSTVDRKRDGTSEDGTGEER